jgi:hypothetical protein
VLFLRLRSARANVSVDLKWHVIRTARVAAAVRKKRPFIEDLANAFLADPCTDGKRRKWKFCDLTDLMLEYH